MPNMDAKWSLKDQIGLPERSHRVGILPVPGFAMMSYSCTVEPLRAANLLSRRELFEVMNFGSEDWIQSSGSAAVRRDHKIGTVDDLDLLIVIAGGNPFEFTDAVVCDWLRVVADRGVQIGGVSGGSVVLANAGLMSGRRMTVHWEHAPVLAERFPDILIERRLYVIDRDRVTCGGGVAPLDLMHALIAAQHGTHFARLVSDWFLHTEVRAAAAPQKADLVERIGAHSPHVAEAVSVMESHVGDPLSLKQLALVAGVTPRHLNRLFRDTLGTSAMDYYRGLRLSIGKSLVKDTAMAIGEIADATGFATSGHFSTAYRKHFGLSPRADRRIDHPEPA